MNYLMEESYFLGRGCSTHRVFLAAPNEPVILELTVKHGAEHK